MSLSMTTGTEAGGACLALPMRKPANRQWSFTYPCGRRLQSGIRNIPTIWFLNLPTRSLAAVWMTWTLPRTQAHFPNRNALRWPIPLTRPSWIPSAVPEATMHSVSCWLPDTIRISKKPVTTVLWCQRIPLKISLWFPCTIILLGDIAAIPVFPYGAQKEITANKIPCLRWWANLQNRVMASSSASMP